MKYQPTIKTEQLLQLQALVPRLKRSNPNYQELYNQYGKDLAGYLGERNLRYYFEFIEAKQGFHFNGLRLKGSTFYVQIDHLIATPHVFFIIESKNLRGLISENQHGQYVQQFQQNRLTFDNPLNQVNIQKTQFEYILRRHGFPRVPIISLVAFPHSKVQLDPSITSSEVMVAQEVSFYINDKLNEYRKPHYTDLQLKQLRKTLGKLHEPRRVNLISDYKILTQDLNPGVLCLECKNDYAQRNYATWTCQTCGESNSSLHIQALRDYAHLYDTKINNRTARWWLGIECRGLAHRLISNFPVTKNVGKKAIEYDLSSLIKNN